jgi:hypothetical protein
MRTVAPATGRPPASSTVPDTLRTRHSDHSAAQATSSTTPLISRFRLACMPTSLRYRRRCHHIPPQQWLPKLYYQAPLGALRFGVTR